MRVMSGYDPEERPDYAGKVQTELEKIETSVRLLGELIEQSRLTHENILAKDLTAELLGVCKAAQPKLQKMIADADEDGEHVRRWFHSDVANSTFTKSLLQSISSC